MHWKRVRFHSKQASSDKSIPQAILKVVEHFSWIYQNKMDEANIALLGNVIEAGKFWFI